MKASNGWFHAFFFIIYILMGFLSSLFGRNSISDEVKNQVREKFISDFFGVNLKSAPNKEWTHTETNINVSGDSVRTYIHKVPSPYFSSCEAKTIGKSATNFFFEGDFSKEHALDVIFLIERDMLKGGEYDLLACQQKYRGDILNSSCSLEWSVAGMEIRFSRKNNGRTMLLGVWTTFNNDLEEDVPEVSKSFHPTQETLNKNIASEETHLHKEVWYENFFGLNLPKSPDETWEFLGLSTAANGNKIEKFSKRMDGNPILKSCEALVINNSATNFFFERIPFDFKKAAQLLFQLEYGIAGNKEITYDKCLEKYREKLDGSHARFDFDGKVDEKIYHVELDIDMDSMMRVAAFTTFVYDERPDINGSRSGVFVPDKRKILEQAKSMAEVACVMASIKGEIVGTKESISRMNIIMCQLVGNAQISEEDELYRKFLQKGDEVKIIKAEIDREYAVTSLDRNNILGYIPSTLDMTIRTMIEQGFVKKVTVFENREETVRILIEFGL